MKKLLLALSLALAITAPAHAQIKGGRCSPLGFYWDCNGIPGEVSVTGIYNYGYRVVAVMYYPGTEEPWLIIEQQK